MVKIIPYKRQLLQRVSEKNKTTHGDFYREILEQYENKAGFIDRLIYSE